MSMKPGATTQPSASTVTSPSRLVPTSVMWPSLTATSARRPGAPVPSTTVPPRITVVSLIPDLLDVLARRYRFCLGRASRRQCLSLGRYPGSPLPEPDHYGRSPMSWKPEIDELRRRTELAHQMGGADKVARQHEFGKLTVRERVDRVIDAGSFDEIGTVAGVGTYDEQGELQT